MQQIYKSYGGWSWAFYPYWVHHLPSYLGNPKFKNVTNIIDPIGKLKKIKVRLI